MRIHHILALGVSALATTACQTASPALSPALHPDMGKATRTNIDAMAIAPTDAEASNTFIPFDRERRARAIEAYRKGKTPEPEVMSTSGN